MMKRLARHPWVLSGVGTLLAGYLKLVYLTNRFVLDPEGVHEDTEQHLPVIVAMWHGQHFLVPFAKPSHWPAKVMISRSVDGEVNAIAARKLGLGLIRASGGKSARQIKKRGGMRGFIEALKSLKEGYSIAMTADVPKGPARKSGIGIVQLARHSGRPILPVAVATSRSKELDSWDTASVNLPFGRGAIAVGDLIWVPSEADDDSLETYRLQVEERLNVATRRAYELVGRTDG
ncbi:lysophospholipid acyltransferase family protein [Roseibium salinum]|uniref:Lysophospholipid acyltransferase family protein n=1 Tax=Roseibium salinum TaxID=1604349 RepID=A0ABT3R3P9_9HYPH|nr:lysophospholipid acyltransferase family protein [Roseibium sp. DSM 29163]MCX2723838.1 lysophospholipid acyltransferase family protein [Roseibium sp. DSM 29163]